MASPKRSVEKDILASAMKRTAAEQLQQDQQAADTTLEAAIRKNRKAKGKPDPKPKAAVKPPSQRLATVTYTPLDEGDPVFTIWHGMKFVANVPREVTNVELITKAKTNPWFSVDGKPGPKRVAPPSPRDTSEDARSIPEPKLKSGQSAELDAEDVIFNEEVGADVG